MIPSNAMPFDLPADDGARALIATMREFSGSRESLEELCATGAMHPSADVRRATIDFVAQADAPDLRRDVIEWLLSDADEGVVACALQSAFNAPDPTYLPALTRRLGTTRAQLASLSLGHNTVIDDASIACVQQILKDPLPPEIEAKLRPPSVNQEASAAEPPSDMARIAGGYIQVGTVRFSSGAPTIHVPEFLIDRFPVTNAQYDRFVEAIADDGHIYCHQDEPPEKDHRRASHALNLRPDSPVSGIDWYDAFAYAASLGKALPTEAQWQCAAMGEDQRPFPWGKIFELKDVVCAYSVLQREIGGELSREDIFRLLDLGYWGPQPVLASENCSPFGVYGLCGNIWEWTANRFLDGATLDPRVGTLSYSETQSEWTAHACVKGGSFTSTIEALKSSGRAKKHVMTRSPEVGFRCVVDHRGSGLRVVASPQM